jgi:CheY-like chemotaxis protein
MPKTVLVVDDDLGIQKMLQVRLTQEGYEVLCASNGFEGLKQVTRRKPDLIISDVMMPVMDGFHFYRAVKNDKNSAEIPFLVITSYPETQDSFLVIGADAFIPKPFNMEELLYRTKQLCAGLRIKSVNIPADKNISKPKDILMVLMSADMSDLNKSMTDELKRREHYRYHIAGSGQEVLEKAIELHPRMILLNVQLKNTPATEVINALNEFQGLSSQILLYAYFVNEDLARDSDLHYFYSNNIEAIAQKSKVPVAYLGAFSKKATRENLMKAVEKYL